MPAPVLVQSDIGYTSDTYELFGFYEGKELFLHGGEID